MRPSKDEIFMHIAELVAKRGTCPRGQCGAVVTIGDRIISTGYNGAPSGLAHCADLGCVREATHVPSGERHELCRGLHAEQNAIIQAAYHGVSIKGAVLYSTHLPCSICVKMVINAGIGHVLHLEGYPDDLAATLISESGIIITRVAKA